METKPEIKVSKAKPTVTTAPIRVKRDTRKRIAAELARLNKKDYGRRIRQDDLINLALSLITQAHRDQLQEGSLSNADRLEQMFREFVKANPGASKDQFLGKLIATNGAGATLPPTPTNTPE